MHSNSFLIPGEFWKISTKHYLKTKILNLGLLHILAVKLRLFLHGSENNNRTSKGYDAKIIKIAIPTLS